MSNPYLERFTEMAKSFYSDFPWRLTRTPQGYYSNYQAKCHVATTLDCFSRGMFDQNDNVQGAVVGTCIHLKEYNYPLYYVGQDFLDAMFRSKLPAIKPEDIEMPFPCLILGLPVKFALEVFKCHVPYIYISKRVQGTVKEGPNVAITQSSYFAVSAAVFNDTDGAPVNYYAGCYNHEPVTDFDASAMPFQINYGESKPEDPQITTLLLALAVKCILAATSRADLVEAEEIIVQHEKTKKGKYKPEMMAPKWIGRTYKLKRESVHHGGTHASPTAHWRAGHIRQQPYGPQRALRKTIWLEPVLVNAS